MSTTTKLFDKRGEIIDFDKDLDDLISLYDKFVKLSEKITPKLKKNNY